MVLVSSVTRLISCCACPTPCTTLYYPSPSNQPSPTLPLIVSPPSPPPLFRPQFLDIFPCAPPFSMTNIQYWASRDILGNYVMSASDVFFYCPQPCLIHSLLHGWLEPYLPLSCFQVCMNIFWQTKLWWKSLRVRTIWRTGSHLSGQYIRTPSTTAF